MATCDTGSVSHVARCRTFVLRPFAACALIGRCSLLPIAVAACALAAAVPAAAQQEPHATLWHACISKTTQWMDDSTSDARSIAAGVVATCRQVRIEVLIPEAHAANISTSRSAAEDTVDG